jgi:hypothetical protein
MTKHLHLFLHGRILPRASSDLLLYSMWDYHEAVFRGHSGTWSLRGETEFWADEVDRASPGAAPGWTCLGVRALPEKESRPAIFFCSCRRAALLTAGWRVRIRAGGWEFQFSLVEVT